MNMSALPPWRPVLLAIISVAMASLLMWALQESLHHSFLVFFIAAVELQQALEEVRTLRGMIPICAACKKIRDDHDHWVALERYIQERTYARFTHGMCKECILEYYPEVYPELFPNEEVPKGSRG